MAGLVTWWLGHPVGRYAYKYIAVFTPNATLFLFGRRFISIYLVPLLDRSDAIATVSSLSSYNMCWRWWLWGSAGGGGGGGGGTAGSASVFSDQWAVPSPVVAVVCSSQGEGFVSWCRGGPLIVSLVFIDSCLLLWGLVSLDGVLVLALCLSDLLLALGAPIWGCGGSSWSCGGPSWGCDGPIS